MAPGRRRFHTLKVSELQSQQLKLVKSQRELETLLGKINESINALKVEELQLKSSAIQALDIQSREVSIEAPTSTAHAMQIDPLDVEINQQQIDLDMFVLPIKNTVEEEEDDESD